MEFTVRFPFVTTVTGAGHAAKSGVRRALWLLLIVCGVVPPVQALVASPPRVEAQSHVLIDFHSGRILSQKSADNRVAPASLTKMMTEFVVFSELKTGRITLDDEVRISRRARAMQGSRMFLEAGSKVRVEALIQGVIVQSGNDASVALAEHIAGSVEDFAVLMNKHAGTLKMADSNFVNAHGLPHADHYTSARDMARLAMALIERFPNYYRWHAKREFEHNGIKQRNRNKLLWSDESVDGIKTGYTEAAGYCLVASAQRGGMRLVSVVMGSPSPKKRTKASKRLLDYGFKNFETHRLYGAAERISDVRVWQGDRQRLALGLVDDLVVTIPRGDYQSLKANLELAERVMAPVARGAKQGTLRISLDKELLAERPLVGLIAVPQGSLWQQLSDRARLMMQ
jgi:serine-type D-Ala-D-Ala carboxypeptidase (penicillin-binding protein 5/6)